MEYTPSYVVLAVMQRVFQRRCVPPAVIGTEVAVTGCPSVSNCALPSTISHFSICRCFSCCCPAEQRLRVLLDGTGEPVGRGCGPSSKHMSSVSLVYKYANSLLVCIASSPRGQAAGRSTCNPMLYHPQPPPMYIQTPTTLNELFSPHPLGCHEAHEGGILRHQHNQRGGLQVGLGGGRPGVISCFWSQVL